MAQTNLALFSSIPLPIIYLNCFSSPAVNILWRKTNGQIVGGAGIFPSNGLPEGTCELVKMYLHPDSRGKGLGKQLIDECLAVCQRQGYDQVYIETMPELRKAVSVYEKFGFRYLDGPLGNTGHFGCDVWMIKEL